MTSSPSTAALEPVRQRLRRDAEDEAAGLRAAAHAQSAAIVADAQRDAKAVLAAAAAQAAATADPVTSAELRRAREAARSAVLTAQRAAVAALRTQPGYEQLLDRITMLAEQAAGPDAELTPAPSGGVVARRPGLVVDCSLDRLADLAVIRLGAEIAELWQP